MSQAYRTRTAFALDALRQSPSTGPRTILDVGFIGVYPEATVHYAIVDAMCGVDQLVGIDVDAGRMASFLGNAKTRQRQAQFNLYYGCMSILEAGFADAAFDVVFMLEVFEHLLSPDDALREVNRILKPGGSLVMTCPNLFSLTRVLRFLAQRDLLDEAYLRAFMGNDDHKSIPHLTCLVRYLDALGFRTRTVAFIKYDYRRLGFLNQLLPRFPLTRKLASYVGVHAARPSA